MQLPYCLLPLLALAAAASAADAELKIDRTLTHKCKRASQNGDTINAHYRGTLAATGTEFDASYNRGQPLKFQLGAGRVIKGWDLGLLEMCPGDKRTLTIPPELGYGSRGMGPIPANSVLVFETELVSIEGVEKEELVVLPKEDLAPKETVVEDVKLADTYMAEAEKAFEDKVATEKEGEKVAAKGTETEPEAPVQEENPQEEAEKKAKDEL